MAVETRKLKLRSEEVRLKSLADFKRFLAKPGATVQLIRHDLADRASKPGLFEPRTVHKLQTNAVAFTTSTPNGGSPAPSWLHFGKAKNFRFCDDQVTVALYDEPAHAFDASMVYKCWIAEASDGLD